MSLKYQIKIKEHHEQNFRTKNLSSGSLGIKTSNSAKKASINTAFVKKNLRMLHSTRESTYAWFL